MAAVNDCVPGTGVSSPFAHAARTSNRPPSFWPLVKRVAWQQSRMSNTSPTASKQDDWICDQIKLGPPFRFLE
jgi:hypothetical protein